MAKKAIALVGSTGEVFGNTLSALLKTNEGIYVFTTDPERLMLNTTNVDVMHLNTVDDEKMVEQLSGVYTLVITVNTKLTDHDYNSWVLREYPRIVNNAIRASVKRLIVVGSPVSEAFLDGVIRHHKEHINGTFVSTEGCYACKAADLAVGKAECGCAK